MLKAPNATPLPRKLFTNDLVDSQARGELRRTLRRVNSGLDQDEKPCLVGFFLEDVFNIAEHINNHNTLLAKRGIDKLAAHVNDLAQQLSAYE